MTAGLALLNLFLHGLGIADREFADRCEHALVAVGSKAVPHILEFASRRSTKPAHRARLLVIAEDINNADYVSRGRALFSPVSAVLIDGLRVRSRSINRTCQALLTQMPGEEMADKLALKACCEARRPSFCARLLETAIEFDCELTAERWLDITLLIGHPNSRVRDAAARLMTAHPARNA